MQVSCFLVYNIDGNLNAGALGVRRTTVRISLAMRP